MSPVKNASKKEPESAGIPNSMSQSMPRKASTSCAPGTGGVSGRQKRGVTEVAGSPLITSNDTANGRKLGGK